MTQRLANFDTYMPASRQIIRMRREALRHAADPGNAAYADLGLWNVYLNPDIPNPQAKPGVVLCARRGRIAPSTRGWLRRLRRFKTPVLRDLEDSAPYFHNGSAPKFDDVVNHYIQMSQLAQAGRCVTPRRSSRTCR